MKQYGVKIQGIGVCLPQTIVKNDDLTALVETSDEWVYTRTGFKERRVVSGNELMTDLGIQAAKDALAYAAVSPEEVGLIVLASSTPDYIYPAGAGVIQSALGAHKAFGFDVAMGCSGLIYAMGIAIQFIENGTVETALVVASDTHSRYTDWHDRNTCVLFGDGAGAFVLKRCESADSDILGLNLRLDGHVGHHIKLPIVRQNCPLVPQREAEETSAIWMNGREVFKYAVGEVPKIIEAAVAEAGLTPQDIDFYVLHQANTRIMQMIPERLNVPEEKFVVSVEKYSNTSAATIPLAFNDYLKAGKIPKGSKIVFCGFGAGMAVATLVVTWNA